MLAVLGGLADVERDLIRTRTAEGRARAVEQGKRMDRVCRITHSTVSRIARAQGSYRPDIAKVKKRGRHPPC